MLRHYQSEPSSLGKPETPHPPRGLKSARHPLPQGERGSACAASLSSRREPNSRTRYALGRDSHNNPRRASLPSSSAERPSMSRKLTSLPSVAPTIRPVEAATSTTSGSGLFQVDIG